MFHKKSSISVFTLGSMVFLLLVIMSLFFWKERILTFDNAFQVFLMLCEERIEVMANRWPATSVRFLPWLFVKLGLPIQAIGIVFSLAYVIIHYIFFLIISKVLKQPRLALLSIIVALFACSEGFYWCNSEQIHGLSASICLLASLKARRLNPRSFVIIMLILPSFFLVLFYHPLLLFPCFFLLFYDQLVAKTKDKWTIITLLSFIGAWFLKRNYLPNWYDTAKSKEFDQFLEIWAGKFFELPSLDFFISEWGTKYQLLVLGFIVCLFLLIRAKRWLASIFVLASTVVYLYVILIGNPDPSNSFYVETNFYTLSLFFYFPILLLVEENQFQKKWFIGLFSFLTLFSIGRIVWYSSDFSNRLAWVKTTIEQQQCSKMVIEENQIPSEIKMLSWSLPYESLIVSKQENLVRSIHLANEAKILESGIYDENWFMTSFNSLDRAYFNNKYLAWPRGQYCDY